MSNATLGMSRSPLALVLNGSSDEIKPLSSIGELHSRAEEAGEALLGLVFFPASLVRVWLDCGMLVWLGKALSKQEVRQRERQEVEFLLHQRREVRVQSIHGLVEGLQSNSGVLASEPRGHPPRQRYAANDRKLSKRQQ